MKIVLDTNILLVSITPKSLYFPVFDAFLNEEYELCVTTEILLEYEEILQKHVGSELASLILRIIENAPNTIFISRYFEWKLIKNDPDDDKFVDCAIACNAKYIVTNDSHFNALKEIPFPKVEIMTLEPFILNVLRKKLNYS